MSGGHDTASEAFWEKHYRGMPDRTNGRASAALVRFAGARKPGRALDLGCARGDDAVWLAWQGWHVTSVDVSETALDYAQSNASRAGMAKRIVFERHDLTASFPTGAFDLVSAQFLQSPVAFPRSDVLHRAAGSVLPSGLLLIAAHASAPPWSWADPETVFPSPDEELSDLQLDPDLWHRVFVGALTREATGPDGQTAMVTDNVIALERRE